MENIAEKIQTDFLASEADLQNQIDKLLNSDYSSEEKEKINQLAKFGFTNFEQRRDVVRLENLRTEKKQIEEIKPFFNGYKFISQSNLNFILNKYGLLINEPEKFTSKIPLESLNYILDFLEKSKKVNIGFSRFDLYIVAPKEMFNPKLELEMNDPIILANRRNTSSYVIVYAWGVEKNILNNEEI